MASVVNRLKKIRLKKSTIVLLSLLLLSILLNIISWNSNAFCDFYVERIFPLWINTYSRLMSVFPFSVGEILIMFGLFVVAAGVLSFAVLIIVMKGKRRRVAKIYGKTLAWILVVIFLIQTLNCFMLYHCTTFGERYGIETKEHSFEDLLAVGDIVIEIANSYSVQVERDSEGRFVLNADLNETAKEAMRSLGETYPQLSGYYPNPKPIISSYFMSQQYLMGIYFPFTLEANYNRLMYPSNMPDTVCHELAHLKGFILEDEANFIAYLACINSGNVDYAYSGAIAALKYIRNQVLEYGSDEQIEEFYSKIDIGILIDWYGNSDYWQSVQEDEDVLIPSEVVNEIGDAATDTNLKLNGVEDGMRSYGRVVDLLLDYYSDSY